MKDETRVKPSAYALESLRTAYQLCGAGIKKQRAKAAYETSAARRGRIVAVEAIEPASYQIVWEDGRISHCLSDMVEPAED